MITKTIIKCRSGWSKLYQPVIDEIVEHDCKNPNKKIGIESIFDYFGTLKIKLFQPNNASKALQEKILDLSRQSTQVCSICGTHQNVGTTMNHDWVTCCEECWQREIKNKYTDSKWKKII